MITAGEAVEAVAEVAAAAEDLTRAGGEAAVVAGAEEEAEAAV